MDWTVWITWWIIFWIRYSRIFWIYLKKNETVADNPSIKLYVNKIENRIRLQLKIWQYLEHLTLETIKLLRITKSKITKDENGENLPHLEITEVVLVHYNIAKSNYQHDSRVCALLLLINHLVNY